MSSRKGTAGGRTLSLLAVLSLMSALVLFLGQLIAFADPPVNTDDAKITICHRTDSATNPYVEITVAREAADGLAGNSGNEADHFGEHKGPLASSLEVAQDLKDDKIEWGDIIPNVDDDGNAMPHSGLNWTTAGQAMWSAGCAFVAPPTSPPPTTPPPTTPPPTTPPPDGDNAKITICHRTDSATNPYVEITVAREAADGLAGNSGNEADHFGEHKGPLASSLEVAQDLKDDKIEWGDIIPNVDDDGNAMPHSGLNWTTAGQAMWSAGCAFVAPPTSPPPTTPPPTTPPPTTPPPTTPPPTTPPPTTPPPTTPPPTTPPPTTPPPTTPPPTTPPPTTPPPTTPPPTVSVLIEKTNDANEDGIYSNNEQSKNDGRDVDFKLVITNTSDFEVEITDLTDSFGQTTLDLLVAKCAGLAGVTLDPDESVTCTFTLNNYSPAQGTAIVNVAEVCVERVGGTQTDCDSNPSRVHTAVVLGQTVTPTPTQGPPPTSTPPGGIAFTGPESAVPLAALAFALLTLGMGLLWAGNRKREEYER